MLSVSIRVCSLNANAVPTRLYAEGEPHSQEESDGEDEEVEEEVDDDELFDEGHEDESFPPSPTATGESGPSWASHAVHLLLMSPPAQREPLVHLARHRSTTGLDALALCRALSRASPPGTDRSALDRCPHVLSFGNTMARASTMS